MTAGADEMRGIRSLGVYLPKLRLSRAAIAHSVGWLTGSTGCTGSRTLGFWDEDALSFAVEAGRAALRSGPETVKSLVFASVSAPFAEPTNAGIAHSALRLPDHCSAHDVGGSARSTLIALAGLMAGEGDGLLLAGDRPVALPGSADEAALSDGGAAALVGSDDLLLRFCGSGTISAPFVSRYRTSKREGSTNWEERWIRGEGLAKLVPAAVTRALENAGVDAVDVRHLVMPSTIGNAGRAVAEAAGLTQAALSDVLIQDLGDTGCAHALVMLAHALDTIEPGDRIVLAQLGQGASALVLEATEKVIRERGTVQRQIDAGQPEDIYLKLPVFNGILPWDKGFRGRAAPQEALSVAYRNSEALLGFVGGRCRESGAVQFPPSRLSADPQHPALDTQDPVELADLGGRVFSVAADKLAFSRHAPSCYGMVDFDGGGRLMMEFTDADAINLQVGDAVRFVFRIKNLDDQSGYRCYFWKAVRDAAQSDEGVA